MAMTLLATNPDSTDVASVSFTSGIDSTYKLYVFRFHDVNPATDDVNFTFQGNAAGESGYNETMTTTGIHYYHTPSDSHANIYYTDEAAYSGWDQHNGTAFQGLTLQASNISDHSIAGELYLFNPSNTTYVKHFYASTHCVASWIDSAQAQLTAGYFNTTSAIDEIQFKMTSGNMDAVIKMYGVG